MTNATKPLSQTVSLVGGNVKIVVDNYPSLKILKGSYSHSFGAAGTSYGDLVRGDTNAAYGAVPASTNLQFWGIDAVQVNNNTGLAGDSGLGYSDDGAGTNYVSWVAVFNIFGLSAVANLLTSFIIPTGKHPTAKLGQTNAGGGAPNISYTLYCLETN